MKSLRLCTACLSLALAALVASAAPAGAEEFYPPGPDEPTHYNWVGMCAESDRYHTQVSKKYNVAFDREYFKGLVVATGTNHADAVVACALAGSLEYRFLYVNPRGNDWLADAVRDRGCERVVIVGGTSAVPPRVEAELRSALPGAAIERVWGTDRYDTSREVAAFGGAGWGDTAIVVSGPRWPDGTSAAGLAAYLKAPVYLADAGGRVADRDVEALGAYEHVIVVGGPKVVSEESFGRIAALTDARRLWGADRYGTNAAVAEYELSLEDESREGGRAFSTGEYLYLVKGSTFADYIPCATVSVHWRSPYLDPQKPLYPNPLVVMVDRGHTSEALRVLGIEERASRGLEELRFSFVTFLGMGYKWPGGGWQKELADAIVGSYDIWS